MAMRIDSELSGGNIRIRSVREGVAELAPDLAGTRGHWFYWAMRVFADSGEIAFRFPEGKGEPYFSNLGPACSTDLGRSWHWIGNPTQDFQSFRYTFPGGQNPVLFASVIPYSGRELNQFLQHEAPRELEIFTFSRSRGGATVPGFRISPAGKRAARSRVVVTARHHACETMGSFVMEGLLSGWQTLDDAELVAIPFMDYDGVLAGEQGKNRSPHDHNRDYGDPPIYPEVAAMQALLGRKEPVYAVDLHCPYIIGEDWNEHLYQVGLEDPEAARRQNRFGTLLESFADGLPYHSTGDLPHGQAWNQASNYSGGVSFGRYAASRPNSRLTTTLEIPYALAGGVLVSPRRARRFGISLARAIQAFIREG
jgi:hypothetical protein